MGRWFGENNTYCGCCALSDVSRRVAAPTTFTPSKQWIFGLREVVVGVGIAGDWVIAAPPPSLSNTENIRGFDMGGGTGDRRLTTECRWRMEGSLVCRSRARYWQRRPAVWMIPKRPSITTTTQSAIMRNWLTITGLAMPEPSETEDPLMEFANARQKYVNGDGETA